MPGQVPLEPANHPALEVVGHLVEQMNLISSATCELPMAFHAHHDEPGFAMFGDRGGGPGGRVGEVTFMAREVGRTGSTDTVLNGLRRSDFPEGSRQTE